ncbi:MAG: hypothetical protein GY729_01265 [Desulfobacteraceae bacterium]|nr:hypothetical protein [Desulfobacteraceae bacterium]
MTKKQTAIILFAITGLGIVVLSMFSGTHIDKYIPQSSDEAKIITLITKFHTAKKEYDIETYLSCLSDDGTFMFGGSPMVSKRELRKRLPGFWSDLKSGDMLTRAFSRESLSGNFLDGDLYDPVIKIDSKNANAAVKFITPLLRWRTMLFLHFQKDNDAWQITRFQWDMG